MDKRHCPGKQLGQCRLANHLFRLSPFGDTQRNHFSVQIELHPI